MDRTIEFHKIASIFYNKENFDEFSLVQTQPSKFSLLANNIWLSLESNKDILAKVSKLALQNEFSNDPSRELGELSSELETRLNTIRKQIVTLSTYLSDGNSSNTNENRHNNLIKDNLVNILKEHTELFKNSLKTHARGIEERDKKVLKYGHNTSTAQLDDNINKFAMFSDPIVQPSRIISPPTSSVSFQPQAPAPSTYPTKSPSNFNKNSFNNPNPSFSDISIGGLGSIRQRKAASSSTSTSSSSTTTTSTPMSYASLNPTSYNQQQLQQTQYNPKKNLTVNNYRVEMANKLESTLTNLGEMFSQLTNLIAEQGELITRIEDDVEIGLENTIEGFKSIENVYEITKGNRSIILKIFLLLVFFIFLFLVWT